MQKNLFFLFIGLSINALGYAIDHSTQNPSSPEQYDSYQNKKRSKSEVAQKAPSSDSRWYKSRNGRQEYLKGGSDYPYKQVQNQDQYNAGDDYYQSQNAPSSDSRWYKSRSGRQEYLKGGSDYPGGRI